jgi:multidrug resistance efflux pump
MEYRDIVAATERQFTTEESSIEKEQAELDGTQARLDRRRKALKRKRAGFDRMMRSFRELDTEVETGQPSRAGDDRGDAAPDSAGDEAAA